MPSAVDLNLYALGKAQAQESSMVDDRSYYQQRAEVETALALRATTPSAMQAHHALAAAYRDRLVLADLPQAIVA